jgi:hypothetical protein
MTPVAPEFWDIARSWHLAFGKFLRRQKEVYGGEKTGDKVSLAALCSKC